MKVNIEFECKCGNKSKVEVESFFGYKDITETVNSKKDSPFKINNFSSNMVELVCDKCEETDWIIL